MACEEVHCISGACGHVQTCGIWRLGHNPFSISWAISGHGQIVRALAALDSTFGDQKV